MSLCNSRGSAIRRRLVRVINKMVVDVATQYFVKCNNNLCRDRIYAERKWGRRRVEGEGGREYVDRADKFCILYCAYNAVAGVK